MVYYQLMEKKSINKKSGRRKNLREDFISGEPKAQSEEALLEILLSYAIPSINLQPLTNDLLARFGDLAGVLAADFDDLISIPGVKEYTATLLKVCDMISNGEINSDSSQVFTINELQYQESLEKFSQISEKSTSSNKIINKKGYGTGMVSRALLKEVVDLLPSLPDTDDILIVKEYFKNNLRFNSENTRKRYSRYITTYLFPSGHVDRTIREFAIKYPNSQELRDVCFYQFCKEYPLTYDICDDILIPNIGLGMINRSFIREYLKNRFPKTKDIVSSSRGFFEAFIGAQIVKPNKDTLSFHYREIRSPSFAIIVHNEFSKPGIYDIEKLEQNRAIRSMLWKPEFILTELYELRNQGLISKVSEIDTVRQFTTKYSPNQLVERLGMK